MADFSALKAAIQAVIKQNGNQEITGPILQEVLLSMVNTMGDGAINSLASALSTETTNRQNADGTLQNNINSEALARQNADSGLQTAVNSIDTRLAEGYVYVGIATAATNPGTPAGKVFYIATAAGTYTNFSGLTVTQGITILKYNGTAWSQDQLVGIDDVPTKESNKLVKSGGVLATINYQTNKGKIIYNNGYYYANKHAALAGHTYRIEFSNIDIFDESVTVKLGIFVKYSDLDGETELFNNNIPGSVITKTKTYTLSSDYGDVEYLRISARVKENTELIYEITDFTYSGRLPQKYFDIVSKSYRGYAVDESNSSALSLLEKVKRIEVTSDGTSDMSLLYKSDGTPRKIAFRNYAQPSTTLEVVDGKRALIWVCNDTDDNSSEVIYINKGANGTYYGLWNGFKVTLYTTGWTNDILLPLNNVTEVDFSLFLEAYHVGKLLEYTSVELLEKKDRLTTDLAVVNNKVGDWAIRFADTDSVVKNQDGSFHVSLNRTSGSGSGNSAFWLLNVIPAAVIGKSCLLEFEAKALIDNEHSAELYYIMNYSPTTSIELSSTWEKYSIKGTFGDTYTDNRLMLYKIAANLPLDFDIKNISFRKLSDIELELDEIDTRVSNIEDTPVDIYKPFANTLYKIAALEREENSQIVIALLGDSWTQHSWNTSQGSTSPAHTNYVQPFTKYMRQKYGNAGGGYYSFSCSHIGTAKMMCADIDDADDTRGGSIVYRDQVEGCKGIDAADATFETDSYLNLNIKTPHDRLVIHFYGDSNAGTFTYTLDGGTPVSVNASGYTGHSTIVINTTDSIHTLRFDIISGSVMLFGVDMQRTSNGVRVHKIGNKGATTESYVIVDTTCWESIFESLDVDSMTILLGVNDGASATTSVQNNLNQIISNIRDVNEFVDITIVMPSSTKTRNLENQSFYQFKAAKESRTGFISLMPLFGSAQRIIDNGTFYDDLHPSLVGGRMICDYLIKELKLFKL